MKTIVWTPRRRWMLLGGSVSSAAAIAIACGSSTTVVPEIDPPDGSFEDAPTLIVDQPPGDGGAQDDAAPPGDAIEAGTRPDGQAPLEAGTCPSSNPCDCDNDGYESVTCNGGTDCDDLDPLRHPNQMFIADPPPPGKDGNWDCTDPIEKQYAINLKCSDLGISLGCPAAQGFKVDPACGTVAPFIECKGNGLSCAATDAGVRRQACK